jgi:hypothetical protein
MKAIARTVLWLGVSVGAVPIGVHGQSSQNHNAPARLTQQEADSGVRPTVGPEDIRIVERAKQILSSPVVWNRKDDRECFTNAKTFSLYCALEDASNQVSGKFAHREAATQEVRFVVDAVAADRPNYHHRLVDYNNDPTTTLADIWHVLDLAETNIRKRLAEQEVRLDLPDFLPKELVEPPAGSGN